MSSYSKLIIFVVILVFISTAILFIDSSTDNMNKSMHSISDSIVRGDSDYNEAVDLVNSKYYYDSMAKADSAEENFNSSLMKLIEIQNNFSSDVNTVHQEYIDTLISEVELKIKAVELLKDAIECFEVNSNYTGTDYASQANDVIYQAKVYQDQRNSIVSDNPDLFKEKFSI